MTERKKKKGKLKARETVCEELADYLDTSISQNGVNHWKSAVLTALEELDMGIFDVIESMRL